MTIYHNMICFNLDGRNVIRVAKDKVHSVSFKLKKFGQLDGDYLNLIFTTTLRPKKFHCILIYTYLYFCGEKITNRSRDLVTFGRDV